MSDKIGEAIRTLGYEELIELQRDLFGGGIRTRQMVGNMIKEINESQTKICATCGSTVNLSINQEYTLIFGPKDIKKRASFCAIDCLEYFFLKLKSISEKRQAQHEETKV